MFDYNPVFKDKVIPITGGTGSFGNFIVNQLIKFDLKEIVILSRDEEKQLDMRRKYTDSRLSFVIADVRDYDRLLSCIARAYV